MRKLILLLCVLLWSGWATAGFDEAMAAHKKGKSDIAGPEFRKVAEQHYGEILKLAEQGSAKAQFEIAWFYDLCLGVKCDPEQARKWYGKAAEQGYAQAQYELANMFAYGRGVPQDYKVAAEWYRKAAEQGYGDAQIVLGDRYHFGEGVPRDDSQATKWYLKAATDPENHLLALHTLAYIYPFEGDPQDVQRVAELFREEGEHGDVKSQSTLGDMYYFGRGMPQNYQMAVKWYRKAAEQGDALAQFSLGMMYRQGEGVPQDYKQAMVWFRKAAEQGDASAENNLGGMYEAGEGVPQNYAQAHKWYNLAAASGGEEANKNAIRYRDALAEKMSARQIEEAQRLAREWSAKHPKAKP